MYEPVRNIEGRCMRCNAVMPKGQEWCTECVCPPAFRKPFKYLRDGAMIVDAENTMVLDVRGFGKLIGGGAGGLGLDEVEAMRIQDQFGAWVADRLNN